MGVGSIHGRRAVATHQRRPFVNRTVFADIKARLERHGVGTCRVSGRAADTYINFFH